MINTVKKVFFLLSTILFLIFITKFYFSEENGIRIIKVRTFYSNELNDNLDQIPVLISDTKNIIEYNNDIEKFKNNKIKRKFWELLGK